MSLITVVIIKNQHLAVVHCHWRAAKQILQEQVLKNSINKKHKLDAGYLVLDFDRKTFVSCQDAMAVPEKGWVGYYL